MNPRFIVFGAVVALGAACGSDDSAAPAPVVIHKKAAGSGGTSPSGGGAAGAANGAGTSGAGTRGSAGAAGTSKAGGAAGASGGAQTTAGAGGMVDEDPLVAATTGYGEVAFDLRHVGSSAFDTAITAKFVNGATRGGTCTETPVSGGGTCVARVCAPASEVGPYPDAGVITIGGTTATSPVVLTPTMSVYDGYSDFVALFTGGEMLAVTAAGHGVPAFSQTITAPGTPTFTAPAASMSGDAVTFSSDADAPVAWTITSGSVVVELAASDEATSAVTTIRCVFPASPASGTVPKAAIATLAAVSTSGTYAAFAESRADVTAGPQTVTVIATAHGVAPGASAIESAGSAVFQGAAATGGSGGAMMGSGGASAGAGGNE